jgi:hypothetical protein
MFLYVYGAGSDVFVAGALVDIDFGYFCYAILIEVNPSKCWHSR